MAAVFLPSKLRMSTTAQITERMTEIPTNTAVSEVVVTAKLFAIPTRNEPQTTTFKSQAASDLEASPRRERIPESRYPAAVRMALYPSSPYGQRGTAPTTNGMTYPKAKEKSRKVLDEYTSAVTTAKSVLSTRNPIVTVSER